MADRSKTVQELTMEIDALRERIRTLEAAEAESRQAQKALKKGEETLRLITDNMSDMIRVTDFNGVNLFASPSHVKGLGYRPEERVGKSAFDIVHPEDLEKVLKTFAEGLAAKRRTHVEYRVRHADGHYVWLDTVGDVLLDAQGDMTALVMSSRDVSERKRAEAANRLNEERLDALVTLNDMIDADEHQITHFAMETAVRLTGSTMGYIAFTNEDETVLTMYAWSKEAVGECAIAEKPLVYPVEATGLWGEAIRQRRAVITNDYAAPNPWKKGTPEGHVRMMRHMNAPVFDGSRIVIVAGVGNKPTDYGEDDVRQLSLLMSGLWSILRHKRMGGALMESSLLNRQVIDSAHEGIVVCGKDLRYQIWNPFMEKLSGRKASEVLGRHPREVFPFLAEAGVLQHLEKALSGAEPDPIEFPYAVGNKTGWTIDTSAPLRNAKGEIVGVISTVQESTERKAAERELLDRERRFRSIFQEAPIGIALVDSLSGRFVQVNQRYCDIVGYPCEELLTLDYQTITHPDDLPENVAKMEMLRRGAVPGFVMEKRYCRKNGALVWARLTVTPLWADKEKPAFHLAMIEDITERKSAEGVLYRSEEKYRTLFENMVQGVFFQSADGTLTDCNRACLEMFGLTRDQVLGRTSMDPGWKVVREDGSELPGDQHPSMQALQSGKPIQGVVVGVFNPRLNDYLWLSVNAIPQFKEGEQRPYQVFVTLHDITERRKMERENALLLEIGRLIRSTFDIENIYKEVAARVEKLLPCDNLIVTLIDHETGTVKVAYASGADIPGRRTGDSFPLRGSVAEAALRGRKGIILQSEDPHALIAQMPNLAFSVDAGIRSLLCVPLITQDEVIGAVTMRSKKPNAYRQRNLDTAERIGLQIAGAVAGAQLFRDLSRTEKTLRESEERLRTILEKTQAGYFFIDAAGRFQQVNSAWLRLHRYESADEVVGRHYSLTQPEHFMETAMNFVREILTGHAISSGEATRLCKDGFIGYHTFSAHPVLREGRIIGLEGFIIDTTEQRRIEESYRTLFREMLNGFALHEIILDAQGSPADYRFLAVNPAFERMTGLEAAQILGRTVLEVLPGIERHWIETYGRVAITGEPACFENHATALQKYFSVTAFRPAPRQFACIFEDITERKQAEEERNRLHSQLLQSQKMESVGRLAGGIAHDFNNMLGIIIGSSEMALERVDRQEPLYQDLQEIRKAAARSADLTRQLLAFARRQTISPKVLDVNETVEGALKMLRRLIGEDIRLNWHPTANLWLVNMDPAQIDQILANLFVNARDAISGMGKIDIETANFPARTEDCRNNPDCVPGEYVRLSVTDNGCGMDQEIQDKLFEPFFTTKETGKGTGLGLATVYGIVKQNGGFISVSSNPGRGSAFSIHIPRHSGRIEPLSQENGLTPSLTGSETILLVEDEPDLLKMTTRILQRQGYKVLGASNPGEAMRLAETHPGEIQLLITDVIMPEMNGPDLAHRLLCLHPTMKHLFVSGYTADVIDHHGVLGEGVHFLQKPFSRKEIAAKVREILTTDAQ
jgi:PAS domain S-box-containing protein